MKTNDEKLNDLINKAKNDKECIKVQNFINSILIVFQTALYSDIYVDLKKLDNKALIYTNDNNIYLLIYKIKKYEID